MCLACAQWELGKITSKEALRNLREMAFSASDDEELIEHYFDAIDRIRDENPEYGNN